MYFGLTYILRRSGDTWRIVVAAIHDPDWECLYPRTATMYP
jgi:hypothetical protein